MSTPQQRLPVRLPDEEIRTMAREVVQGQAMVTNEARVIQSAFYIMTSLMDWSTVDVENVGALYGPLSSVVPGRAMNGYPIFLTMRLVHRDDLEAFDRHLAQMQEALK